MKVKFIEFKGDWENSEYDDNDNKVKEINWYYHKILLDDTEIEYYIWRTEFFDEDGDGKGMSLQMCGDYRCQSECNEKITEEFIIELHQKVEEEVGDLWVVEDIDLDELYKLDISIDE